MVQIRNRKRNLYLSKVGTGTGTVTNSYGSTTLTKKKLFAQKLKHRPSVFSNIFVTFFACVFLHGAAAGVPSLLVRPRVSPAEGAPHHSPCNGYITILLQGCTVRYSSNLAR
jgi:hypothetical protein